MNFWKNIRNKFNKKEEQDAVTYHIDSLVNDDGKMSVKGWIFSTQANLNQIQIVLCQPQMEQVIDVPLTFRKDIVEVFSLPARTKTAFEFAVAYASAYTTDVFLQYAKETGKERRLLCTLSKQEQCKETWFYPRVGCSYEDDGIEYHMDTISQVGNRLYVRGWIFSNCQPIDKIRLVVKSIHYEESVDLKFVQRTDVAHSNGLTDAYCGISQEIEFATNEYACVFLEYMQGEQKNRIFIAEIDRNTNEAGIYIQKKKKYSYKEFVEKFVETYTENLCVPQDAFVDLIVPVYNGYEFLENMFAGIEKTAVPYQLYVVNDCSPDERVLPYLREYAQSRENVVLLENGENLGFVQSVNRALEQTRHHVVLVNTDVMLPEQWLERLMMPIWNSDDVASTTPFTNSGTICSFPRFCENNHIFMNKSEEEIDRYFRMVQPQYVQMPTGVGFCMGMNRKVIDEIGNLDADTFYKGYGEENDWCQRAIHAGYCNVQVENLFVWHKHGGSFLSEDKKRYIERNSAILEKRYPEYKNDVNIYCTIDPNYQVREYVKMRMIQDNTKTFVLVFDHNWGGGANKYMEKQCKSILSNRDTAVMRIVENADDGLQMIVYYEEYQAEFGIDRLDDIYKVLQNHIVSDIIVNELVAYKHIVQVQEFIADLKRRFKTEITMLCHDFYPVCPSIYLLNDQQKHCFLPANVEECEKCYRNNTNKMNLEYVSISSWRSIWAGFLSQCDHVITFSENTKSYYEQCYPDIHYEVVPHQVDYIEPVEKIDKTSDIITIGYIGNMMPSKGSEILIRMAELIEEQGLNARIVVVGPNLSTSTNEHLLIHGKYSRDELPDLMKEYQVDIVFIASIWPETFSYTTEEAIKMGMKVAAFDLGAPAERLKKYDKGIIIPEISAESALDTLLNNV